MVDIFALLAEPIEGPLSQGDAAVLIRMRDALREQHVAIEAMRVCIVYARDRRGGAFDFDTWSHLVQSALDKGQLPPHAIEEAQSDALRFRSALWTVQAQRDAAQADLAKERAERAKDRDVLIEAKRAIERGGQLLEQAQRTINELSAAREGS